MHSLLAISGPPGPPIFTLPLLIFCAEVCVVTLSTVRIIFVARGKKYLATLLGCFEVSIWLFAIGQVMQNLDNIACSVAFAAGFAVGTYLGIVLEAKLALGTLVIRTITRRDPSELVEDLKASAYGVTTLDAQGTTGPVRVVLTVVKRRELDQVVGIIKRFDAKAFYSVEDLQHAAEGVSLKAEARVRGFLPRGLVPWHGRPLRVRGEMQHSEG